MEGFQVYPPGEMQKGALLRDHYATLCPFWPETYPTAIKSSLFSSNLFNSVTWLPALSKL